MTRKKPNYTQFMKRPAPLELSPPSDSEHSRPRIGGVHGKEKVSEEEIPWGEIIVEFGPNDSVPLQVGSKAAASPRISPAAAPPRPPEQSPPAHQQGEQAKPSPIPVADIEGMVLQEEPRPLETPLPSTDPEEEVFPYPETPPLLFMAIAVVLLLCLL